MSDIFNIMFDIFDMESIMPFREKIAWVSLVGTIVVWGLYFGGLALHGDGGHDGRMVLALVGAVVLLVIIMGVSSIVIAIRNPSEAQAPRDERDRQIAARAAVIAYPVLMVAVICAGGSAHLGNGLFGVLNALLGAMVLGETVRQAALILGYRRA